MKYKLFTVGSHAGIFLLTLYDCTEKGKLECRTEKNFIKIIKNYFGAKDF